MHVLVISDQETGETLRFVHKAKTPLKEVLQQYIQHGNHVRYAWRLWHDGWIDGSYEGWKSINDYRGEAFIL